MKKCIFLGVFVLILVGCTTSSGTLKISDDPRVEQIADAIYLHNQGEHKKALQRFEDYGREGNVLAMYQAGVYHRDGTAGRKDILRAKFWFEAAGRYGHANALRNVGYIYEYGLGVHKNIKKAQAYYLEAANLGSHLAAFELGSLYLQQQNFKDARLFLERACSGGVSEACERLKEVKF